LMQIGAAAALYRNDEKEFPSSLAFLLPADTNLADGLTATAPNPDGTGYLKSTKVLTCPDDDKDDVLRSSYGDISINLAASPTATDDAYFASRYVWNFYGYIADGTANDGTAYKTAQEASDATSGAATPDKTRLVNMAADYDARKNPIKYSMSNRFAPSDTIITHCVFHRTQTSAAISPTEAPLPVGAVDIVLRVDNSAKLTDISGYATAPAPWQFQNKK